MHLPWVGFRWLWWCSELANGPPVHDVDANEASKREYSQDVGLGRLRHADQDVGDKSNEDLDADGVLGGAEEVLDPEVLLGPFEEQLDLPTLLVEVGDLLGWGVEIVGEDAQDLAG